VVAVAYTLAVLAVLAALVVAVTESQPLQTTQLAETELQTLAVAAGQVAVPQSPQQLMVAMEALES
jgi:hypothetical protein